MKNANEVASALEMALGQCAEVVPKGFRTMEEWCELWGCAAVTAWKLCKKHVNAGRMEKKKFRVQVDKQRNRPITHYRAIK